MGARQQLDEANVAISTAIVLLNGVKPTLEQFMAEAQRMDSVGPIIDPTLFNSPERRATEAILKPIYKAALDFIQAHEMAVAVAKGALEKVTGVNGAANG